VARRFSAELLLAANSVFFCLTITCFICNLFGDIVSPNNKINKERNKKMTETAALPSILIVPDGAPITGANRFLAARVEVDWRKPYKDLLAEANSRNDGDVPSECFPPNYNFRAEFAFEVVRFNTLGVTPEMVRERFEKAGMYPADFYQMMAFVREYRRIAIGAPLLALGSTNESFLKSQESKYWFLRRWWRNWKGKWKRNVAYPCFEYFYNPDDPDPEYQDYGLVRLSNVKGARWKPHCLFLGVHIKRAIDQNLKPLFISREDYLALPDLGDQTKKGLAEDLPFGFRAVDPQGLVFELIRGEDTPQNEWGNVMSLPPPRWRRFYRPEII